MGQYSCPEEDLRLPNPVEVWVQLEGVDLRNSKFAYQFPNGDKRQENLHNGIKAHHPLARLLPVHEPLRYDIRSEQLVPLPKLLKGDPIRESLPADPDAL